MAWTRYGDNQVVDEKHKHLFQIPKGKPFRHVSAGELYRVSKPTNHWENLRRSKAFIADDYFPPFTNLALDGNLTEIFEEYVSEDKALLE